MKRFVEGEDRSQSTLFSERLDDYVCEDNPGRVVDIFVDELDLGDLGFNRIEPLATGRPSYHPTDLMKLYIYCYLNRVQSSRRLEREAGHNVKVMWLGASFEAFDDHHCAAAFRARIVWRGRINAFVGCRLGALNVVNWHVDELSGQLDIAGAAAVGEQAVMSDAMEAARQDVEEEAADELVSRQGHELLAIITFCAAILPLEGDAPFCLTSAPLGHIEVFS